MNLKVNKDLEKVIAKMFPEQYETLKQSIKERGQEVPIEVMADGTIIDGHHRYQACRELGIEPTYKVLDKIKSLEEAKEYAIVINIARRHLSSFQKAEMGMTLLEIEQEKSKLRQGTRTDLGKTFPSIDGEVGEATEIVAKKIGVSYPTLQRAIRIIEKAPEDLKTLVRDEKLSIWSAYKLVQALEEEKYPLPKDKKEEFYAEVTESVRPEEALENIYKRVVETNTAKSLLGLTEEGIAKEIEKEFKNSFYTPDFKAEDVKHAIQKAEGHIPKLKRVFLPEETFESEEEAEHYFKKYGGRHIGKITTVMWVGEVDPYEWKQRED